MSHDPKVCFLWFSLFPNLDFELLMCFSVFWVYGFFCFLGLWVQYSCVWDFGFWNWNLRVLGIASFVLILLITNSLRFCANFGFCANIISLWIVIVGCDFEKRKHYWWVFLGLWVYQTCGCLRRPRNIGDVSMYVPSFWIPKPIDFSHSLGDHLSKNLVERLSALRTRIVIEKTWYCFTNCETSVIETLDNFVVCKRFNLSWYSASFGRLLASSFRTN